MVWCAGVHLLYFSKLFKDLLLSKRGIKAQAGIVWTSAFHVENKNDVLFSSCSTTKSTQVKTEKCTTRAQCPSKHKACSKIRHWKKVGRTVGELTVVGALIPQSENGRGHKRPLKIMIYFDKQLHLEFKHWNLWCLTLLGSASAWLPSQAEKFLSVPFH